MSSRPFPWPWRGPENRRVVLAGLLWIALLVAWGFAMHDLVPGRGPSPWPTDVAAEAPLYARFDSGWYRDIARDGYGPPPPPGRESEHAFFPLYPYLARAVHVATGLGVFRSLLLVAWAAFLLALPLFLEEARRRGVPEDPWRALPFLLLYPSAFFLQAAYSDAVFFLVALLAFRALRSGSVAGAVALGFVAGLCRAPAAALGPALAVAWWLEENGAAVRWKLRTLAPAALLGVAPLAGVLSYMFGIGLAEGGARPLLSRHGRLAREGDERFRRPGGVRGTARGEGRVGRGPPASRAPRPVRARRPPPLPRPSSSSAPAGPRTPPG